MKDKQRLHALYALGDSQALAELLLLEKRQGMALQRMVDLVFDIRTHSRTDNEKLSIARELVDRAELLNIHFLIEKSLRNRPKVLHLRPHDQEPWRYCYWSRWLRTASKRKIDLIINLFVKGLVCDDCLISL